MKFNNGNIQNLYRLKRNIGKGLAFLIVTVLFVGQVGVYGAIDEDRGIVSADIVNTYTGRTTAGDMQENLGFQDVATNYWGREAIIRMGALDVTKGYISNGVREFRPIAEMSKEEALAFIMRSIGLEEEAKLAAEALGAQDDTTIAIWSKGYLSMAQQNGLITGAELADALNGDQTVLDPEFNFIRTEPVSRELMSMWLVQAINGQNPGLIEPLYRQQNVLTFDDFEEMDNEYIPYIEAIVEEEIMVGDGSSFNPKDNLLRAEMMQIMENMDRILYDTMELVEKSGYVGHVETELVADGAGDNYMFKALIRTSTGEVEQLTKENIEKMTGVIDVKDALVYRGNQIQSLSNLQEGDTIHYVVDEETKEVYYVEVVTSSSVYHVQGVLEPLLEYEDGIITIADINGNTQRYIMADTLYDTIRKTIVIDEKYIAIEDAPVTNRVTLTISNQLVSGIDYGGYLVLSNEFSGLVIEHNRDFNYIRVSDWDGNEVVKRYVEGNVEVEKEEYYDSEDQVGYFDQLFPYYGFDEDDASIDDIETGDIVHIQLESAGSEMIAAISAKTNYTVKYGEILTAFYKGDEGYSITLEMDDHSIASYTVDNDTVVIKGNDNVTLASVESGNLVRILVNQAVIAPGSIVESVKEINIDPNGNVIANIYKGELGSYNKSQETLSVLNSYELIQTGWSHYSAMTNLDISKEDIEYYYEDERITLAYADNNLRTGDMDMYVATEEYFGEERITKVTFRDNRDSVLPYSNVTVTNGFNEVETQNYDGSISIDDGTIVVKNDKLISASNVMAPDYTQIVLNGSSQAAIVQVKPEPNNDALSIMRGRVSQINDYEDFTVQSHAVLSGMDWIYSPIERTYEIDYKTLIKDSDSTIDLDEFIGYTDSSKIDTVYTIVAEGVNATHIIEGPYCLEGVSGEIFEVSTDSDTISIKDTVVYDTDTKEWNELSRPNSYSKTTLSNESIILKNNEVISIDELEIGDTIRIMTETDLVEELTSNDNRVFSGYIVYVE